MFCHKSKENLFDLLKTFYESCDLAIVFVLSKPGLILRTDLTSPPPPPPKKIKEAYRTGRLILFILKGLGHEIDFQIFDKIYRSRHKYRRNRFYIFQGLL